MCTQQPTMGYAVVGSHFPIPLGFVPHDLRVDRNARAYIWRGEGRSLPADLRE